MAKVSYTWTDKRGRQRRKVVHRPGATIREAGLWEIDRKRVNSFERLRNSIERAAGKALIVGPAEDEGVYGSEAWYAASVLTAIDWAADAVEQGQADAAAAHALHAGFYYASMSKARRRAPQSRGGKRTGRAKTLAASRIDLDIQRLAKRYRDSEDLQYLYRTAVAYIQRQRPAYTRDKIRRALVRIGQHQSAR